MTHAGYAATVRIALVCGEAAGARLLQALAAGPHEIVSLLASGAARGAAERLGYRPQAPERVREPGFAAELAAAGAELLLNVHSLYLVPEAVLCAPPHGAWNLHPGPLPRYAGLNAPSWAIYHGEQQHGVTVHRMARGIDTGDIAFQELFPVTDHDTGLSLSLRCAERGVGLMLRLLEDAPSIPRRPQDPSRRSYFGAGVPQDGRIDWSAPARRVYDFVRACDYGPFRSPWGTPRARLDGEEVEIRRARLTGRRSEVRPGTVAIENDLALVACADEWLAVYQRSTPKIRSGTTSVTSGTKTSSAVTAATASRNGSDSRV
jgi:UDP-4-amino-4-deoxy-L-arabinose formyltransferase/UDP-glucuronic acid dehydrogenase (UDP-4-keto-hexauronic acid decarboxylating)